MDEVVECGLIVVEIYRLILVVGISMLGIGILANQKAKASCGVTHHHMLSIGGILCFVHALFSIAFYVSATSHTN